MVDTSLIMRAAEIPEAANVPALLRQSAENIAAIEQAPLINRQQQARTQLAEDSLAASQEQAPLILRQQQARTQQAENRVAQEQAAQKQADAARKALIMYNYATQLKSIPMAQRRTFLNTIPKETLEGLGISPEDLQGFAIDDASIDTTIAQLEPIVKQNRQPVSARRSESLAGGRITVQELDDGTVRYLEFGEEIPPSEVKARVEAAQKAYEDELRGVSGARRGGALDAELETKPEIERRKTKAIESEKDIQEFISEALPRISAIEANIQTYDEVIDAIDAGARTGAIVSRLPSINEASKDLENLRIRLGLDVVSMASFGALSESEMKIALSSALPTNKSPEALREWVLNKKRLQREAAESIRNAVSFLNNGGTIGELIEIGGQKESSTADNFEGFELIE